MVEVKFYSYLRDATGYLRDVTQQGLKCNVMYVGGYWTVTIRHLTG